MSQPNYYNEIDPFAAETLRNLIAAGHIAPGVVDERSIEDVKPDELVGYTQCHFFAGIGVWSHALRKAGWPDDLPVWTGSCPCQPFSAAGKGDGFHDERHLWPSFHWLIAQRRPAVIFGEQVASRDADHWIDLVQADLEALDYAVGAVAFPAAGVGAPVIGDRLYWVGSSNNARLEGHHRNVHSGQKSGRNTENSIGSTAQAGGIVPTGSTHGFWRSCDWLLCADGKRRPVQPSTFPLAHGTANRVGRLSAYGNAINASQAQIFIEAVKESI